MLASNSALIASERAILPPDAGKRFVERSCRNRDKEDNRNKYNKSSSTHANRRFLQKHKRKNAYLYQLLVPYIAYSILKFSEQIYHFFFGLCPPARCSTTPLAAPISASDTLDTSDSRTSDDTGKVRAQKRYLCCHTHLDTSVSRT